MKPNGLVAAAQQITARGGNVIGNSFKTILTRLQSFLVVPHVDFAPRAVNNIAFNQLEHMSIYKIIAILSI